MTEQERKEITDLADTLREEINKMCVTDKDEQMENMYQYAMQDLTKLANLIYYYKFKENTTPCSI